jgi:hypothetical protein
MLSTRRWAVFYLEAANHKRTPLSTVVVGGDGRLTVRSADGKQGQEHGAVSPRQYVKPGDELSLENPVIRTGIGTLAVHGVVTSGQYLQYQGGDTAGVFGENWIEIRDLPVEKRDYTMPAGYAPVSVTAKTKPWLEVQFMTEGDPMIVRP